MADNQPQTGMGRVNRALGSATPYGMDVAMRMGTGQGAAEAVKGMARDNIILKLLGPTAVWAGATMGVLKTMESIVKQSGILERGLQRISTMQGIENKFEGLYKSAERASAKMKELQGMSLDTPFKADELAQGALLLERLTKGAYASAEALREVGDLAAATGNDFVGTAQAVGKLMAAIDSGRSLDRMMFQMQQTGLMTEDLARKLETLEAAGQLRTGGKKAIRDMLQGYQGSMARDMKTLEAVQTKNSEANTSFDAAFGKAFTDAKVESMESSTKALQNMTPVMEALGQAMQPVVTVSDSIKHKLVDMTLGTKTAQAAFLSLIPVVKGLVLTMSATAVGGIAGHLLGFAGRVGRDWGKTGAALERAKAPYGPARMAYESATEFASNILADPNSRMMDKARAYGSRALAWTRYRGERIGEIHRAAMDRAGQTENDGGLLGGSRSGRYVATWGKAVGGGAIGIAKTAASAIMSLVNPLYLVAAAALAAGAYMQNYANSMEASVKAQMDLRTALSQTNAQIRAQINAAKSYEEWEAVLGRIRTEMERVRTLAKMEVDTDGNPVPVAVRRENSIQVARMAANYDQAIRERAGRRLMSEQDQKHLQNQEAIKRQSSMDDEDTRQGILSGAALSSDLQRSITAMKGELAFIETAKGMSADAWRSNALAEKEETSLGILAKQTLDSDSQKAFDKKRADLEAAVAQAQTGVDNAATLAQNSGGWNDNTTRRQDTLSEAKEALAAHKDSNAGMLTTEERNTELANLEKIQRARGELYALQQKSARENGLNLTESKRRAELEAVVASEGTVRARLRASEEMFRQNAERTAMSDLSAQKGADIRKAQLRGDGNMGAAYDKETELLKLQRDQAKARDDKLAEKDFNEQLADRDTARTVADRDARRQMGANDMLLRGDRNGFQTYQDLRDKEGFISQMTAQGMGKDKAAQLWQSNFQAQFAGQLPQVRADSLQSIGGGGGYYAGADPMKTAQDRLVRVNELSLKVLERIDDKLGRGAVIN